MYLARLYAEKVSNSTKNHALAQLGNLGVLVTDPRTRAGTVQYKVVDEEGGNAVVALAVHPVHRVREGAYPEISFNMDAMISATTPNALRSIEELLSAYTLFTKEKSASFSRQKR